MLLAVAAVPVVCMAAWIAWQNGAMVAARSTERAARVRAAAVARYDMVMVDAVDLLGALAARPDLLGVAPETCDAFLRELPPRGHGRYANISLLDAEGRVRCSAAPLPGRQAARGVSLADQPWYAAARQASAGSPTQVSVGPVVTGRVSGRRILVVARPLDAHAGMAALGLSIDWLAAPQRAAGIDAPEAVWLIDAEGETIPIAGAPASALPPPAIISRLLTDDSPVLATSQGGTHYAYAGAVLSQGLRLLVAAPAAADLHAAARVVLRRFALLALLVATGLALVAHGVNRAVIKPLKSLGRAVGRWRGGGTFDPVGIDETPLEVRELSASFSQATAALAEREHQLRSALAQQDLLMQEIHHRVKNNLQIIASLLNLQAARIRQPEARAEFQAARDRIRALATLHRHLYAEGELQAINMRSFLHELCDQLLQAVGSPGRIGLTIEAPELQISSDQAVPLALIVTEAVSNAVKYAFPGGRSGAIQVRLTTEGESRARLVLADNGVGIAAGRSETETGVRDGIGLHLIRGFARQLGADLTVTENGGTRYELVLTLRRGRGEAPRGTPPGGLWPPGPPGPARSAPSRDGQGTPAPHSSFFGC